MGTRKEMNTTERFHEILATVNAAYGSLDQPHFAFAAERYRKLKCHPVVNDLMSRYFVRDETDLNDHVAMHIRVLHPEGSDVVCLSFVDKWAMLFRLIPNSLLYERIIETGYAGALAPERDIIGLLQENGFKLLTKVEAAQPIAMNLFNTERGDTRIYHAIISDDGVIPQVLLG